MMPKEKRKIERSVMNKMNHKIFYQGSISLHHRHQVSVCKGIYHVFVYVKNEPKVALRMVLIPEVNLSMEKRIVVVTGGAGYIGSHTVVALVKHYSRWQRITHLPTFT